MKTWFDYEMETFEFDGTEGIVVFPKKPRETMDWAFKTEYWGAYPDVELMLLEKGFHVAHLVTKNRWANKEDCDRKAAFAKYISEKYGLSKKCIPIGMSCGGAQAVKFAGYYPELVACMYIDAPLLNFCSIPGRNEGLIDLDSDVIWENEFVYAYPGLKRYQIPGFDGHPLCFAEKLVENKIPIVMAYGTQDRSVIWEENGKLLAEAYEGTGLLKVFEVGCRGHHPHHTFCNDGDIVDFIIEHCK